MDGKTWAVLVLVVTPVVVGAWRDSEDRPRLRNPHRDIHHQSKRHMQSDSDTQDIRMDVRNREDSKRRVATPRYLKKLSGQLAPLLEDDMDNDEVVSVAINPPSIRPKYDRINWKQPRKPTVAPAVANSNYTHVATYLVQDILTQLGREFLTRQVSEDFVFGQYVGNAMRNISSDLKLKMQHEVLDLIVRYQKLNRGEMVPSAPTLTKTEDEIQNLKSEAAIERRLSTGNDTEDAWPELSNLSKIVGR